MASSTSQLAIGAADLVDHHPARAPRQTKQQQTTFAPASGPFAARGGESGAEKSTWLLAIGETLSWRAEERLRQAHLRKCKRIHQGAFQLLLTSRNSPPRKLSPPPPQAEWAALAAQSPKVKINRRSGNVESDDDSDEDFPADFEAEDGGESVTQLLLSRI